MSCITHRQFSVFSDCRKIYDFMTEIYCRDWSTGVPAPFFEYAMASFTYCMDLSKCHLEPLCTVPEHRGKGLDAAAVSEMARRMQGLGATHMTGGGNEFYTRIGYKPAHTWTFWKK